MADTVKQIFHIEVDGEGKITQYTNSLKDNQKQTDKNNQANKGLTGSFKNLAGLAGIAGATIAIRKLTQFLKGSVEATNQQIEADTRLTTIMRTVTGATDEQIRATMELADAYQGVTTVGDEVIQMGQSQLASFGFNAEATQELTGSLLDLAVAQYGTEVSGEQLIQTANMLGKAYTGLPGMLSRAGVLLSDQQSEMIRTGDEAERLATLIEVVEQNYGGLAEAMAQTPQGRIQQITNEFEDFREEIGTRVLPVVGELATGFQTLMSNMEETGQSAQLLDGLEFAVKGIATAVMGIGFAFDGVITTIAIFVNVVGAEFQRLTGNLGHWTTNMVLTIAETAANGAETVIHTFNDMFNTLTESLPESVRNNPLVESWLSGFEDLEEGATHFVAGLEERVDQLRNASDIARDQLLSGAQEWEDDADELAEGLVMRFGVLKETIEGVWDATPTQINEVTSSVGSLNGELEETGDIAEDTAGKIELLGKSYLDAVGDKSNRPILEEQASFWDEYSSLVSQGLSGVAGLFQQANSARMEQIDQETQAEIEAIKETVRGKRAQKQAIEEVEKKAEAQRKQARMKEWRNSLLQAGADTASAVIQALPNIPLSILVGGIGLAQTGIIASNKPRFYYGSRDSSGDLTTVGGNSAGDTQMALLRSGETVLTPQDTKRLNRVISQGGNTSNQMNFNPQFNFNGGSLPDAQKFLRDVSQPLEQMVARVFDQRSRTNTFNPAFQ